MAHTMSAPTAGETYSGTPLMVRAVGCVGSDCSSARLEPATVDSFRVDNVSAVAN